MGDGYPERTEFRLPGSYNLTPTALRYLRGAGANGVQAGLDIFVSVPMKYRTVITHITFLAASDPGSTIIAVHLDRNGTPLEAITADPGGAATIKEFVFTSAAVIPAGGEMAISVDTTDAANLTSLEVVGYQEISS